ncbi:MULTISPECIES: YppG family protein [Peribacillus]|uniref:YppG family protein n=1 Tax=Peribacillus TaxID=2675229 RepID=UPI001F4E29B9|nr:MULTISPECIES: YppG family protein [unclassified Peribacillus]MCK1982486.1 YppG family protein [Peribacillus sp. Aquil_B1]MCK2007995.1 YppG family protein [Peribacillus sp. Aquil_B8]
MMRSGFNQISPNQGQFPQSMTEYWGGYQQPMPYPPPNNHNHEQPFMYPYHLQDTGGYMTPYHDPYQQAAYHPFQAVQQQAMPVGAYPGSSVMQPMAQMQPIQSNQQPQAFSPFANPLQPAKRPPQGQQQAHNPYPKQQFMQKPQPSGFKSVMNQFKTQDGSMDITKMMNTAGQMMNTVSQVSSMVKGVGGFFKA